MALLVDLRTHALFNAILNAFEERFIPEPNTGCWLWIGPLYEQREAKSYGCFAMSAAGIKKERAHRTSWRLHKGAIPPGMCLLHRCDTPLCVNPDHLSLGSHQENMRDMKRKGRAPRDERSAAMKLHPRDVINIKRSSESHVVLAKRFGVAASTISNIKCGWRRSHIS